jgi:exopolyphosphatase/pppGpp-phosphohydrolase
MPLPKRLEIASDLAAIPKKFNLQISIGQVERSHLPPSLPGGLSESDRTIASHAMAFMTCAMNVEHWMRRNAPNEVCMLVAENNDQARKFIAESQRYHQDKKIIANLTEFERKHFPLRKIKEDPLFQPKRQNHPLVVADFVAYVWKKILMKDKKYDQFMRELIKSAIYFADDDELVRSTGAALAVRSS